MPATRPSRDPLDRHGTASDAGLAVAEAAPPSPEGACIALQALADAVVAGLRAGRIAGTPPLPDLPRASVRLSGRLTRVAGVYRPPGDIAVSGHYLAQHGAGAARGVVLHELAHHAVRARHGRSVRPHGPEFQAMARALGADLQAAAFAAPRTVYVYRCPACGWAWRRGRRLRRGRRVSCFRCAPAYDDRFRLAFAGRLQGLLYR